MPVVNGEIEIAFPDEKVSNTAQRLGVVSRAKLGRKTPIVCMRFTWRVRAIMLGR